MRVWVPVCVKQSGGCIRVSKMQAERYHRSPLAAAVGRPACPREYTKGEVEQRTWLCVVRVRYTTDADADRPTARPTD